MKALRHIMIAVSAATTPCAAMAQEAAAEDWDLHRTQDVVSAYLSFTDGLMVAVRCQGRAFHVFASGLPPQRGPFRTLRFAMNAQPEEEHSWLSGTDPTVAFSNLPERLARRWRDGGRLVIEIPLAGETPRRFVVDLPRSEAAIDAVLDACDKPRADPRDAMYRNWSVAGPRPTGMRWVREPSTSYPNRGTNTNLASVTLSCIAQEGGRLGDCVVESEFPPGRGFGSAALQGAGRARVASEPPGREHGRLVTWTMRFRLQ